MQNELMVSINALRPLLQRSGSPRDSVGYGCANRVANLLKRWLLGTLQGSVDSALSTGIS